MNRLIALLIAASAAAMLAFLTLFVVRNAPGFSNTWMISAMAAGYAVAFLQASRLALLASLQPNDSAPAEGTGALSGRKVTSLLLALLAGLLVYAFVDSTLTDYYQPLSLYDDAIAALAFSWGLLCIALLLLALRSKRSSKRLLYYSAILGVVALLGVPLAASLQWVNAPEPNPRLGIHRDVYNGNVDGYDVYRIPALLVLRKGSRLANGTVLGVDKLLAFAEARRNGALDTGEIDLVLKTSIDGGNTWGEQRVVCKHMSLGKCGNATPVFDSATGLIHLAYNTSSSQQKDKNGQRLHEAMLVKSSDSGLTWSTPRKTGSDNFVFGPGHGIQKQRAPHKGRLLLPGYLPEHAMVIYSDDGGEHWQRSEPLDTGNESELAELPNGDLYLTTRHRAPIGRPPSPNGRLFSTSSDGGQHWLPTRTDTGLSTPVCQASVILHESTGGLLFSNPAHEQSRVNMAIRYSSDGGVNWNQQLQVYPGPAGYSVLGAAADGDILLLYERGNMAYSEKISFARADFGMLNPDS